MNTRKTLFALSAVLATAALPAAEYYVNHETGDDMGKGTIDRPFRTFHKSLEVLQGGDTLHILPTKEPYREKFGNLRLNSHYNGTPEKPTVIEGHGSRLSAMVRYPLGGWTDLGGGVWKARPRHNVVCMGGHGYYKGPAFVKVDVGGGKWKWFTPVAKREGLKDFEMFWCLKIYPERKWEKDADWGSLYVKLPKGMTPETNEIHLPQADNMVIGADYCVVRDIDFEWSTADCIDTERTVGSVIENVTIDGCLDQCISAHSTKGLDVKYSYFAHALAGNVLDITFCAPDFARVNYIGCVFGEGTGVRFAGGSNSWYRVEDCVIRDETDRAGVLALKNVHVTVRNCVTPGCVTGVQAEDAATILAEDCDFTGAKGGFELWTKTPAPGQLTFRRCVFRRGQRMAVNGKALTPEEARAAGIVLEDCSFDGPRKGLGFTPPKDPKTRRAYVRFGAGDYLKGNK